jgi:hypothetical protein
MPMQATAARKQIAQEALLGLFLMVRRHLPGDRVAGWAAA